MNKSDKLRAALREAGNRMTRADAVAILGAPGGLSNMMGTGELSAEKIDGKAWIVLAPNYTRMRKAEKALPLKRKKKPAANKKTAKTTGKGSYKIRALIAKLETRSEAPPLQQLIAHNLRAACALLRATVVEEIDNLDANPRLNAALANAERAESMAEAA